MHKHTQEFQSPEFLAKLGHLAKTARKVLSGEVSAERRGKGRSGGGTLFQEYRTYSPGDDPRTVDWNIYGRLGELFVKVFEPEGGSTFQIFLDRSASMQLVDKARLAAQLAAAFGYIALVDLAGVRLVPFPAQQIYEFHTKQDVFAYLQLLHEQPAQGTNSLVDAVQRTITGSPKAGSINLIISDYFPANLLDRALAHLNRTSTLCIHLLSPVETQPNIDGPIRFQDPENQRNRWIPVTPRVRERFDNLMRAHLREVSRICAQRGAAYYRTSTSTQFDVAVLQILTRGLLPRRIWQ